MCEGSDDDISVYKGINKGKGKAKVVVEAINSNTYLKPLVYKAETNKISMSKVSYNTSCLQTATSSKVVYNTIPQDIKFASYVSFVGPTSNYYKGDKVIILIPKSDSPVSFVRPTPDYYKSAKVK